MTRPLRLAGFAILFVFWPAASRAEEISHYAIVQRTLEAHVLPHIQALKTAAEPLPRAVAQVCETGADAAREELATQFRRTIEAYAGVDFLRFGPMVEAGRRERLSFWPDPRGIMNRQLRQVMLAKDAAMADPATMGKQSAAVQGLPALEVLMTDETAPLGPSEADKYTCLMATSIATNIAALASDLAEGWEKPNGWKDKMLRPGSDNDTYKEPGEAAAELVKAMLTGFQLTADLQLKPQLDPASKLAGPYSKSGLSKQYFEAYIASLHELYDALALENFLPEDKDWVKNWAGGAWRTISVSDGRGGVISGAQRSDAPLVREVFDKMSGLRKLAVGEMSVAAGLTIGFNELDGD